MSDRSAGCHILHVDMDAFYAAVAVRDRPDLADVPVIVGGGNRSVVLSATYPARRYGVHSAMPMAQARRLCPRAVVIRPSSIDIDTVSTSVMAIFRRVTPMVEVISIDEAFLDVSGSLRRFDSPLAAARLIQAQVTDEQRITCSVGVSTAASVAKLASKRAKPDGVVVVPPDRVTGFLHPLPVQELWGVGPSTRERLNRLGLHTVGDLAHTPVEVVCRLLGPHRGAHVHALAWGADGRRVGIRDGINTPGRSIGSEETFGRDTDDPDTIARELLRLSAKVAARLRAAGLASRTVELKVRFSDFTTITRSRTLHEPTDVTGEIHAAVMALYSAAGRSLGRRCAWLRLVGVRVEGLTPSARVHRQRELGSREHGWPEADRAVDRAAERFGTDAVRPASLLAAERP